MEARSLGTGLIYYLEYNDQTATQGDLDVRIDPGSVSKLFYALYFLKNYEHIYLVNTKLRVKRGDIRRYGRGTRKLSYKDIFRAISLLELIQYSLQNSCNIATGMLADYAGRENVNRFIHKQLGLSNTTIYGSRTIDCPATANLTTINDLVKTLKLIQTIKLSKQNKEFLFATMQHTSRRAVIKSMLSRADDGAGSYVVFSKGGTTFQGLRRDVGIFTKSEVGSQNSDSRLLNSGLAVFVQILNENHAPQKFTKLDKILAKAHLGRLHKHLVQLDQEFQQQVAEVLVNKLFTNVVIASVAKQSI